MEIIKKPQAIRKIKLEVRLRKSRFFISAANEKAAHMIKRTQPHSSKFNLYLLLVSDILDAVAY
jgi:hypothetical protein